jgi:hypothetical protein
MTLTKNKLGQSLIELLITISLLSIMLPVLGYGFIVARDGKTQQQQRLKATALLKEATEAVRSVRERSWNEFAVNGTFHAVYGNSWSLSEGTTQVNGYNESIVISDTMRDISTEQIIIGTGKTDPSTKKVSITISWTTPQPASVNSTFYLTRLDNISKTYTTRTDFGPGDLTNTFIVDTDSGIPDDAEVVLGSGGGGGNWCLPSKSITTVDLPKQGVANAITAIEGSVFAGTGENASGVSFAKVGLTTDEDPPVANLESSFDGYKTNSVYGETDYAYLTTDTNGNQVVILDLNQFSDSPANTKYQKVGSIDLGTGSVHGQSVYVADNTAYITASNGRFYIYDVSNHSSPVALNGSGMTLDGIGKKVLVAGSYAYIATTSTTYQLDIVNISNKTNPFIEGKLNLGTGKAGVDVYVNPANPDPARAYLATEWETGKNNFFIIDVSAKSTPTVNGLSSFSTSGMQPTGVTVVTGNKAIIVGTGGANQYQVIDVTNETGTLSLCATLQYSTGIQGVSSVLQSNGYAYSYIVTGDANSELKIILGGAGGQYSSAGTYTSEPFDNLTETAFNRFTAMANNPPQTEISLQVAVAESVNDSCDHSNYTYIGPDRDNPETTFFTVNNGLITGPVPYLTTGQYYANPGRCFRYKVYLSSSDSTKTPSLFDFTVNYSP